MAYLSIHYLCAGSPRLRVLVPASRIPGAAPTRHARYFVITKRRPRTARLMLAMILFLMSLSGQLSSAYAA